MGEQVRLGPKIKIAWLAPSAAAIAVIWLILSAGIVGLSAQEKYFGIDKEFMPIALLFALVASLGIPVYAFIHLSYINFTYELAETELIIRQGILTRKTIVIPYVRIQNINSERTVLERLLGLATLAIETAGTNVGESEALLPGISNRYELINHILALAAEAKQTGSPESRATDQRGQVSRDVLFQEMLGQLVQLNKGMIAASTREIARDALSKEMLAELRRISGAANGNGGKKPQERSIVSGANSPKMKDERTGAPGAMGSVPHKPIEPARKGGAGSKEK
jgi:uncharacterized membrane protein YdbT with pleckstrin-like domain